MFESGDIDYVLCIQKRPLASFEGWISFGQSVSLFVDILYTGFWFLSRVK